MDILIKAAVKLDKEYSVYIVGGETTDEYLKLIWDLNLNNVHFKGFKSKDELKKYYLASDLFVLPTREDIWGLVINEAISNGLPAITTDKCVAGIELVKNDENGFVIHVDDEKNLSRRINEILENDDLLRKMSGASLNKSRFYTLENMASVHINIFNKIMETTNRDIQKH